MLNLIKKGLKGKMALFWICWRNLAHAQNDYKKLFPLCAHIENLKKKNNNKDPQLPISKIYTSSLPISTIPSIGLELKLKMKYCASVYYSQNYYFGFNLLLRRA